jgi:hypothetical protein
MKTGEALILKKHLSRLAEMDQKTPLELSGSVRLRLAKAARACETVEADFEKVRIGLIRAKGNADAEGNYSIEPGSAHFREFAAAVEEVLDSEAEGVPPLVLTAAELNLDKNRVPIDVLNGLMTVGALKD